MIAKNIYRLLFFLGISIILNTCQQPEAGVSTDLPEIKERGRLTAITGYSPISYFLYRGEPMGYEYELLKMLGQALDLPVEIVIARDLDEMFSMLANGEGDLIAHGLTITNERRRKLSFTKALNVTHQVLVQRKPDNWRQMKLHEIENLMIRSPFGLDGETLVVRRASAYVERLKNLALESGLEIEVEEAKPGLTTEDLISMVADGEINLTVADENIAQIQSAYYSNLDISTPLSLPQQTGWAVRPQSPLLLEAINAWLTEVQQQADYYVIYNKYYKNRQAFRSRYADGYSQLKKGVVSPYDEMIRKEAARLGWDWRLLAALIYRESEFRPDARSWAGAAGLMQLMPATARNFGVENPYDPAESITAGVDLLLWLDNYWLGHISDQAERLHFVLASYNVGQGHVQDARRLAGAHDANPDVWQNNVAEYMLKKSNPAYYNLEMVYYGYASGNEPVRYIEHIFEIYEHYRRFVD